MPDTPTLSEWVVFLQQNPDQANQHALALREKIKAQGLIVDPALILSIEEHEEAQHLLATATNEPQQIKRIARLTALGQATLGPYPNRKDWSNLIQTDSTFAQLLCTELEIKRALLGSHTPQALQRSIENYYLIANQQQA
jgi:hypothetical protein